MIQLTQGWLKASKKGCRLGKQNVYSFPGLFYVALLPTVGYQVHRKPFGGFPFEGFYTFVVKSNKAIAFETFFRENE